MIISIIYLYLSILFGSFIATVALIFYGSSWGNLPRRFLQFISTIQSYFPVLPQPEAKKYNDGVSEVEESECHSIVDSNLNNISHGIDAIVNGDLASCFSTAPTKTETLLRIKPLDNWSVFQTVVFYLCFAFRIAFLLPVRVALLISSFVFVAIAGFMTAFKVFTDVEKTWIAIIYCRLFCASMGLVAKYNNLENRPRKPGVAVSNHLTPNDIQILFAGTPHGSDYGYVVTGQKHNGIIGLIEHLVEKLCPSLWLERKCSNERQGFLTDVLNIAKTEGPVLLFPEGYCSNNTKVLQFRKAVFEKNVNIYPIAVKQEPEYGDGFWYEDEFHWYLLRVMTSWAVVYDIQYLDVETRMDHENNADFANRVQNIIAKASDISCCKYGGNVWYKSEERLKLKEAMERENARNLIASKEEQQLEWEDKPFIENIDSAIDSQYEKLITVFS